MQAMNRCSDMAFHVKDKSIIIFKGELKLALHNS